MRVCTCAFLIAYSQAATCIGIYSQKYAKAAYIKRIYISIDMYVCSVHVNCNQPPLVGEAFALLYTRALTYIHTRFHMHTH